MGITRQECVHQAVAAVNATSYLEIGCDLDEVFNAVDVPYKVGVDPIRGGTLRMSSDEFFRANRMSFDVVLIDGLHVAEQVLRDITNAAACLNENGVILVHDTVPWEYSHTLHPPLQDTCWVGDGWRTIRYLRAHKQRDIASCFEGLGFSAIFVRENTNPLSPIPLSDVEWHTADYATNRDVLLNRLPWDQWCRFLRQT